MKSELKLGDVLIFEKRILEKEKLRLEQYYAANKSPSGVRPNQSRVKRASFGFR